MKSLTISPPLLNSANPWCTTLEQLQEFYNCPHTGAVTTRTSLLEGFAHDPKVHQFTFFNPNTLSSSIPNTDQDGDSSTTASLNTLGYSPIPLQEYLQFIKQISDTTPPNQAVIKENRKPFIISVTGSVEEIVQCYHLITSHQPHVHMPLAMEVNLSCPNIPGKPPPAYSSASLLEYLCALKLAVRLWFSGVASQAAEVDEDIYVPIGIKTPPYTYHDQYQALINALLDSAKADQGHMPCPLDFITATNTLGSALLLSSDATQGGEPASPCCTINSANGTGIGGLAGPPLHPLALGNVATIRALLTQHKELERIAIIGVGGVEDVNGYHRMRHVGAEAVGIGTALGRKGIHVFEEIGRALEQK